MFCQKKFINRKDNPFKLSDKSFNNSKLHKIYEIYKISVNKKIEKVNPKDNRPPVIEAVPSDSDKNDKNLPKDDKTQSDNNI